MKNHTFTTGKTGRPDYRIRLFVPVIILCCLTGCRTSRMVTGSERTIVDSVRIVETVRDTVVAVRGDSSLIRALIECDSLGQAHLSRLVEYQAGERMAPPRIEIRENVLTATAQVDSLSIYLELRDKYREAIRKEYVKVVETIEVNRLTRWQRFWLRTGQILSLLLLGYAGLRLRKLLKV